MSRKCLLLLDPELRELLYIYLIRDSTLTGAPNASFVFPEFRLGKSLLLLFLHIDEPYLYCFLYFISPSTHASVQKNKPDYLIQFFVSRNEEKVSNSSATFPQSANSSINKTSNSELSGSLSYCCWIGCHSNVQVPSSFSKEIPPSIFEKRKVGNIPYYPHFIPNNSNSAPTNNFTGRNIPLCEYHQHIYNFDKERTKSPTISNYQQNATLVPSSSMDPFTYTSKFESNWNNIIEGSSLLSKLMNRELNIHLHSIYNSNVKNSASEN